MESHDSMAAVHGIAGSDMTERLNNNKIYNKINI